MLEDRDAWLIRNHSTCLSLLPKEHLQQLATVIIIDTDNVFDHCIITVMPDNYVQYAYVCNCNHF